MGLLPARVALVTGAASGIGRATAVHMAEEGASGVVLVDIDGAALAETGNLVAEHGAEPVQVVADVTDDGEVAAAVASAVDRFGRLDCAFNNAGTSGMLAPIAEYPLDDWHRVMALNLTSVFLCLRHEIPAMIASGGGAIVNTSSGAGVVGNAGQAAYVASKHGVLGLTRTAAREVASAGIRVNAVCPGTTRTPMLEAFMGGDPAIEEKMARVSPLKRLATPEEIARAVVWLCSDAASYVVGHSLIVDGGAIGR
jgi:NAD(P)-dependent dehydrogenase (short-subunit alcohol dehydrogenase family)